MFDSPWQSVHLYYYEENKDDLILDCVRPLFQQVSHLTRRVFFVRHWLRGPHLRLRFACPDELFLSELKPTLVASVKSYIQQHPSRAQLDLELLEPQYSLLARQEKVDGPLLPLYPDNSLQDIPYDSRVQVLGSPLLASIIEDFYVGSTRHVFAMLEAIRRGYNLQSLCFDLLVTTAQTFGSHVTRGSISYRSHAEGFLLNCASPEKMRAQFEQKYATQAPTLTRRLRKLLAALQSSSDLFPFTLAWRNFLQAYWRRAEPLIRSGELDMMPFAHNGLPQIGPQFQANLGRSAFHSALESDQERKRELYQDGWFQTYRLMLNLLYLHLSRLGLRPVERFLLCHLVADTVEQAFDFNITAMLQQSITEKDQSVAITGKDGQDGNSE